jgi:hypothetical protein
VFSLRKSTIYEITLHSVSTFIIYQESARFEVLSSTLNMKVAFPPKCQCLFTRLHHVTPQDAITFIFSEQ